MTRGLKMSAGAAMLLLACTPTKPCACTPPVATLTVYGVVRTAAGAAAAGAAVHYRLAPLTGGAGGRPPCEFDEAFVGVDPDRVNADVDGRFRSVLYSRSGGGTRCLRVTAYAAGSATDRDSARVDGLLVPFKDVQPDSVGLVLTLR